jgi:hypothetical protein
VILLKPQGFFDILWFLGKIHDSLSVARNAWGFLNPHLVQALTSNAYFASPKSFRD